MLPLHTENLWLNLLIFAVGLAFLVKGSDFFVDGAAYVARHFSVPKVVIGLTLVSMGTSLPELATDVYAAICGLTEADPALREVCRQMPMGDTPGSNISNIFLVLGIAIFLMKKVPVNKLLFNRDSMVMAAVFMIFAIMYYNFDMADGNPGINRIEGGFLLLIFLVYTTSLFRRKEELCAEVEEIEEQAEEGITSLTKATVFLVIGSLMIPAGSKLVVDNVSWAAKVSGIPPQIITATIVAFGTSLPELSVTVIGVLKRETDIALGNIIGSCIFNLVFVMATASVIAEVPCGDQEQAFFIIPCMLFAGALLIIFMRTGWSLDRWEGIILLCCYVIFISLNIYYGRAAVKKAEANGKEVGVVINSPGQLA